MQRGAIIIIETLFQTCDESNYFHSIIIFSKLLKKLLSISPRYESSFECDSPLEEEDETLFLHIRTDVFLFCIIIIFL